jgi:hypothetical protein
MNQKDRHMIDGSWYDLSPPVNVRGKEFSKVCCEYQHPKYPNEYVVKGIPIGENDEESFVLKFTEKGTRVTLIDPPVQKPKLKIV